MDGRRVEELEMRGMKRKVNRALKLEAEAERREYRREREYQRQMAEFERRVDADYELDLRASHNE